MILQDKLVHIFDLDDTLINTKQAYFDSYLDIITKSLPINRANAFKLLTCVLPIYGSYNYRNIFRSFFLIFDYPYKVEDIEKMALEFERLFWYKLQPHPGVDQYLITLTKKHKKLALATNGKSDIQRLKLSKLDMTGFFQENLCMISSEQSASKPAADMLNLILHNVGCDADQAVFYGNNSVDMLAAKNAGLDFILYTGGEYKDDKIAELDVAISVNDWKSLMFNIK